jgi:hypothetical protein
MAGERHGRGTLLKGYGNDMVCVNYLQAVRHFFPRQLSIRSLLPPRLHLVLGQHKEGRR